jgi:stage V sporulation protein R
MQLITQEQKKIMEGCKARARDAGLQFDDETLEYVISNREFSDLEPKVFIPTLYDYWVNDVISHAEKNKYKLFPHNAYECVVNTRPAMSFYNCNNPDWLNVMIYYHVLGHIDFFQNNNYFRHTWGDDFKGRAQADKYLIDQLRTEKGRFVDYVIEFSRGLDNLVNYYGELKDFDNSEAKTDVQKSDYYFSTFLQKIKKVSQTELLDEVKRYNDLVSKFKDHGKALYFIDVIKKYPEFEVMYDKEKGNTKNKPKDLLQFISEYSQYLNRPENLWMKQAIQVVRDTSIYFQPQIRTKIMNEGWATYWHEKLFLGDNRLDKHEIPFGVVNSGVTTMPRLDLNPYALGRKLFMHIQSSADRGRYCTEYHQMRDQWEREMFDKNTGKGLEYLFWVRKHLSDADFISRFTDQEFMDANQLFVAGRRLNFDKGVWEIYVKNRKAQDYKDMVLDQLYHPPYITYAQMGNTLHLNHHFEGKPLVKEYIYHTMVGAEYLWGGPVQLETSEIDEEALMAMFTLMQNKDLFKEMNGITLDDLDLSYQRVLYHMENKQLKKAVLK